MMRPSGWQWRGDFFDPEIPLGIELHCQFWSAGLEHLPAEGTEQSWEQRVWHHAV